MVFPSKQRNTELGVYGRIEGGEDIVKRIVIEQNKTICAASWVVNIFFTEHAPNRTYLYLHVKLIMRHFIYSHRRLKNSISAVIKGINGTFLYPETGLMRPILWI